MFDASREALRQDARFCMNGHDLAGCLNIYLSLAFPNLSVAIAGDLETLRRHAGLGWDASIQISCWVLPCSRSFGAGRHPLREAKRSFCARIVTRIWLTIVSHAVLPSRDSARVVTGSPIPVTPVQPTSEQAVCSGFKAALPAIMTALAHQESHALLRYDGQPGHWSYVVFSKVNDAVFRQRPGRRGNIRRRGHRLLWESIHTSQIYAVAAFMSRRHAGHHHRLRLQY